MTIIIASDDLTRRDLFSLSSSSLHFLLLPLHVSYPSIHLLSWYASLSLSCLLFISNKHPSIPTTCGEVGMSDQIAVHTIDIWTICTECTRTHVPLITSKIPSRPFHTIHDICASDITLCMPYTVSVSWHVGFGINSELFEMETDFEKIRIVPDFATLPIRTKRL